MKISDLVAQLQFLEAHYGDLECVLHIGEGFQSMRHLRVDRLGEAAAGSGIGVRVGDRVSIISAGETSQERGRVVRSRAVSVRRSPAEASVSH